jgi:putative ABC transport system permease protein
MKKRIDFLKRDVKQNRNKFIAVVLITALAVGFLTGLISIAPDMEYTADKYYDDRDFWDLKINSTLGFTEEDIETIKNQKYVEKASGVISLEVNSSLGGEGDYATLLYAVDFDNDIASGEMLSSPILSKGSYPINNTSCVVLKSAALKNDIKIGDKIYLNSGGNILSEVAFTVTGIANAPEFASTQKQSSLSGEKQIEMVMYVSRQVYPAQSIYTDVYVKVKGTKELNAFSHKYDDAIKTAKTKLTALSKEREKVRDESITGQHQALLGQATDDYKQHEAGIRTQLAAQKKYINSLKKGIEKSEKDIEKLEAKLATQKANLDIQAPTIEALKALGATATAEQKATIKKYNEALKKYNKGVKDL